MRHRNYERQLRWQCHAFGLRLTHTHGVNTEAKMREALDMIAEAELHLRLTGAASCLNICSECDMSVGVARHRS